MMVPFDCFLKFCKDVDENEYLCHHRNKQIQLIMPTSHSIIQENEKRYSRFNGFGEMLFWSYANLQMLSAALSMGKAKYDRSCYKVRAKAFKAYKEGRWNIHDLFKNNIDKLKSDCVCWYCGEVLDDKSKLTIDHVFPRSKGGANDMDNIIMVCKHCNSSKRDTDLLVWYFEQRQEFPPVPILAHYLKQIYLYAKENDLMNKHREEIDLMALPFNYRYIPLDYPQPEYFL